VEGRAGGIAIRAAAAAQVFVDDPRHPVLEPHDLHHLSRALRLRDGEEVVASDGRGAWGLCRFRAGAPESDALVPDGDPVFEAAERDNVLVAFAPAKGDRPEWVVQKLTELGVDRILPLVADRSVVRWEGDRARRSGSRLVRVAREAAAQCRRVWIPEVLAPCSLAEARGETSALVLAERDGGPIGPGTTGVAVGPEGGWSPAELELGLERVGLGEHVLRAETAAVAAGVLLGLARRGRRP
jgi:16S rRNA (uracil1498-N3)-methyltransferase